MSRWRRWLPRVLLESALIVFSVLLALALNEWREGRSNRAVARQAQASIRAEIERNRGAVRLAIPYHDSLYHALREGSRAEGPSLRAAFLQNSAWETAQTTQAPLHMQYSVVAAVSEAYELQERYQQIVGFATQAIYSGPGGSAQDPASWRRDFANIVSDLLSLERALLERYDAVLELLRPAAVGPRSALVFCTQCTE